MEDWAFVETALGPSHVYDLTNPSAPKDFGFAPKDFGGLDTPWFDSYFEPINIDGVQYLLGVVTLQIEHFTLYRLQISVFDMSDPTNLQYTATYVEEGASSSTGSTG